jgi:hypothetical protein
MFKRYTSLIESRQNELLVKLTALFWLCEKLIGWRVWTAFRLFPTAPVFEFLDGVPWQIHLGLFLLELALLLLLIFLNNNKLILISLLICEILSILLDQTRLQPYEYQCIILAFVFLINGKRQNLIPAMVGFILAATYFYSGIGKFNDGFLKMVWESMIVREFFKVPTQIAGLHWFYRSGYILGLAEMLAGLGLIFPTTQKKSAVFLILMHVFVLVLIGPFGLNYNKIVWPWNAALIFYLYIVFLNKKGRVVFFISIFSGLNKLVFILLGVLPVLNTLGYWDNYLSSSLYSGKLPKMIIGISDTTKCKELNPFFKKNRLYYYKGEAVINVQDWSTDEMNTLPYPELRALKQVALKLQKKYPEAELTPFYFENNRMVNNN